jgi:signal transduction histidine kinase
MTYLAEKAEVTLVLGAENTVAEGNLDITANKESIQRLVSNLLSNAIKFTPRGGLMTVGAVRKSPETVELYVSDTGIGMSPQEVELASQLFRQVDASLTRKYEGLGLGLPIAQAIAAQHWKYRARPEREHE